MAGTAGKNDSGHVAVIDIGSNAVRFVVFDEISRGPIILYNERTICGLGKGMAESGRLNPDGVKKAYDCLARYAGLIENMKIGRVRAVATAAVRDARDGSRFVRRVKENHDIDIEVLSGEDEARLSAVGVLANGLGADGIIGDFGGGSLELIAVENMQITEQATLPIGALRVMSHRGRNAKIEFIDEHIKTVDFLHRYQNKMFYTLGGAWRAIGWSHIYMSKHPVYTLDHYGIGREDALRYVDFISHQSADSLSQLSRLSRKRGQDMPAAALVMDRLLRYFDPSTVLFSATGLREGLIYDLLSEEEHAQDPLIVLCSKIAEKESRFGAGDELLHLADWMAPLFPEGGEKLMRLIRAACLLSDFGWFEHENFRAEHAFQRILLLPFYGVGHDERMLIALAVYFRYMGQMSPVDLMGNKILRKAGDVLDETKIKQAHVIGTALWLAYMLTGGALGLLKETELKLAEKTVRLALSDEAAPLRGDIVQESLDTLAGLLGRKSVIQGAKPDAA